MKRLYFTLPMSIIFPFILRKKIACAIFIYMIKTFSCYEIIRVHKLNSREKYFFSFLDWYFIVVSDIYLGKKSFIRYYRLYIPKLLSKNRVFLFLTTNSVFLSFGLYMLGVMIFIITLRRSVLKKQLSHFAIVHFAIIAINIPAHLAIWLVFNNRMWFFISISLVVVNDTSAYLVGKSIGRTQLLKLSPKKTVEGMIGASIVTLIWGFGLVWGLYRYYPVLYMNMGIYNSSFVKIPMLYLHILPFIFFASFVAPFGGFFASAYKRLFRLKDFSDAIPGHGGVTDRIDCQFLMIVFTYTYLSTFLRPKKSVEELAFYILKNYSSKKVKKLAKLLLSRNLSLRRE